ncbi:hypothetical protein LIER_40401 [Lithospermum erythrorhizon]|uniref:Gag-pol polyprotein n=1 Tax=Lithospermum erythrorhizon TaxID=34254 RepID=A0AAV3QU61_LITER
MEVVKEGTSITLPPLFDGTNYPYWKVKMTAFLSKALNVIFCAVDVEVFKLISSCTVAKEAWEILEIAYEETQKVRMSRLQQLTTRWETLRMEEDETIATYNSKIKDIANESFALGERRSNEKLVRKVLRTLPKRFAHKVTTIEEVQNLTTMRPTVKTKGKKIFLANFFNKTLKHFNKKPYSGSGGNSPGVNDKRIDKRLKNSNFGGSSNDEEEGSDNKVNDFVAFTARNSKEDTVNATVFDHRIDNISDDEEDLTEEELMLTIRCCS